MAEQDKPNDHDIIPCEVCLKEIPTTEAKTTEGTDYVVHFCGLDCYEQWRDKEQDEA